MRTACFAAGLFACGFVVHWVWWRVRVPVRQSAAILQLFLVVLAAGLLAGPWIPAIAAWAPRGLWPCLHVAEFHIAATLAYIVAYSALEGRSPSMTLLIEVADAKDRGRSREELLAAMAGFSPIDSRLAAMERDGMITADGDRYRLAEKGRLWDTVLVFWRRLVGLEIGG